MYVQLTNGYAILHRIQCTLYRVHGPCTAMQMRLNDPKQVSCTKQIIIRHHYNHLRWLLLAPKETKQRCLSAQQFITI